jgi:hypothetical protein
MKTIFFITFLIPYIFLVSCKKNSEPNRPNSEFSFTADGIHYTYNGSLFADKGSLMRRPLWSPGYSLIAKASWNEWLWINIPVDDLEEKVYDNVEFSFSMKDKVTLRSQNCTIAITSLHNNLTSGTFSGEVYLSVGSTPILITSGRFKDVKVD